MIINYKQTEGRTMTEKAEFPRVLAAVKKGETDLWEIADAVLKDCGDPSEGRGHRNGNYDRIAECASFLEERGYEYSTSRLREFQRVAHAFPKDNRLSFPLTIHFEAGTPDVLKAVIARLREKAKAATSRQALRNAQVTKGNVRREVEFLAAAARREREAANKKARAELERAEAKGDLPAVRSARAAVEATKVPPARGGGSAKGIVRSEPEIETIADRWALAIEGERFIDAALIGFRDFGRWYETNARRLTETDRAVMQDKLIEAQAAASAALDKFQAKTPGVKATITRLA